MPEILHSKFFKVILSGVLILVIVFLARELEHRYQINKEIENLQTEIETLENKNSEALDLINYFKTNEYKERQARSLLNLQKPGEFVVALPYSEQTAATSEGDETKEINNFLKWWEYFFAN